MVVAVSARTASIRVVVVWPVVSITWRPTWTSIIRDTLARSVCATSMCAKIRSPTTAQRLTLKNCGRLWTKTCVCDWRKRTRVVRRSSIAPNKDTSRCWAKVVCQTSLLSSRLDSFRDTLNAKSKRSEVPASWPLNLIQSFTIHPLQLHKTTHNTSSSFISFCCTHVCLLVHFFLSFFVCKLSKKEEVNPPDCAISTINAAFKSDVNRFSFCFSFSMFFNHFNAHFHCNSLNQLVHTVDLTWPLLTEVFTYQWSACLTRCAHFTRFVWNIGCLMGLTSFSLSQLPILISRGTTSPALFYSIWIIRLTRSQLFHFSFFSSFSFRFNQSIAHHCILMITLNAIQHLVNFPKIFKNSFNVVHDFVCILYYFNFNQLKLSYNLKSFTCFITNFLVFFIVPDIVRLINLYSFIMKFKVNQPRASCLSIDSTVSQLRPSVSSISLDVELSWRRLQLSRSKLKQSAKTSALFAGFAMVAMVEVSFNNDPENPVPPPLLVLFGVCTTSLVSVHILSLIISTCILPSVESIALLECKEAVHDSPHERLKFFVDLSWTLSR